MTRNTFSSLSLTCGPRCQAKLSAEAHWGPVTDPRSAREFGTQQLLLNENRPCDARRKAA